MFKSTSTSLILLGVLGVIVGIVAIAWPGVTILALVILFAVFAFIRAGLQAMRAFSSATAGPVFGRLLLALIDLAAGALALVWPGPTALVLVLVVAIWAFVAGFTEIFTAFGRGEAAGTRAMFIVTGLISIAFGVVLSARPDIGALARVRRGAVRLARSRHGHRRVAVRVVQPDLRRVADRGGRPAAPDRAKPAHGRTRCRLSQAADGGTLRSPDTSRGARQSLARFWRAPTHGSYDPRRRRSHPARRRG
jgi:uncharacterized membrane protein HdeD (DUF308 family)